MQKINRHYDENGTMTEEIVPLTPEEALAETRRSAMENLALQLDAASTREAWAAMSETQRNETLAAICAVGAEAARASIQQL